MTDAAFALAQLRSHVRILDRHLGARAPACLTSLSPAFARWLRQLARAGNCADLDALAAALKGHDDLLAAIEAMHATQALTGIAVMRKAFAGIEAVIDATPMATPGQEPTPDALLDLPTKGVLGNLLKRVAQAGPMPVRKPVPIVRAVPKSSPRPMEHRPARSVAACVRKAA